MFKVRNTIDSSSVTQEVASIKKELQILTSQSISALADETLSLDQNTLSTGITTSFVDNSANRTLTIPTPNTDLRKIIRPLYNSTSEVLVETETGDSFIIDDIFSLELKYTVSTGEWTKVSVSGKVKVSEPTSSILVRDEDLSDGNQGLVTDINAAGDLAVFSAPLALSNTGQVYVTRKLDNSWVITQTIIPRTETNSLNGTSLSLSRNGKYLGVGSPGADSNIGQVAIYFADDTGMFTLQQTLQSINSPNSLQGTSVHLSNDGKYAVVGGPGQESVWVYTRQDTLWSQQQIITPTVLGTSSSIGSAKFGSCTRVSAKGDLLVVGGNEDDSGIGGVWIYQRFGEVWRFQVKLTDASAKSFGSSIWLDQNDEQIIIGAPLTESGGGIVGAAWVYSRIVSTWMKDIILATSDVNTFFGKQVFINGETCYVSGTGFNQNIGAVWKFTKTSTIWSASEIRIDPPSFVTETTNTSLLFGESLSLSANTKTLFVGVPGFNGNQGASVIMS